MLKPSACKPCQLYTLGSSFSANEGKGRSGVIMVGEALGHDEGIDGLPFRPHAQAGSKLEECIKLNGFTRDDFLITNIIRCQPPGNRLVGQWYAAGAIAHCTQTYLKGVIESYVPPPGKRKVILALGSTAYTTLTGRFDSVLDIRGYCFCDKWGYGVTVVATLHPSFIKRGKAEWTPLLVEDIKKAVGIAGQEEWETPEMTKGQGQGGGYVPKQVQVQDMENDDSIPF